MLAISRVLRQKRERERERIWDKKFTSLSGQRHIIRKLLSYRFELRQIWILRPSPSFFFFPARVIKKKKVHLSQRSRVFLSKRNSNTRLNATSFVASRGGDFWFLIFSFLPSYADASYRRLRVVSRLLIDETDEKRSDWKCSLSMGSWFSATRDLYFRTRLRP